MTHKTGQPPIRLRRIENLLCLHQSPAFLYRQTWLHCTISPPGPSRRMPWKSRGHEKPEALSRLNAILTCRIREPGRRIFSRIGSWPRCRLGGGINASATVVCRRDSLGTRVGLIVNKLQRARGGGERSHLAMPRRWTTAPVSGLYVNQWPVALASSRLWGLGTYQGA